MLPESRLDELYATVTSLLWDADRLARMRDSLTSLARPDAADRLTRLVIDMAGVRQGVAA